MPSTEAMRSNRGAADRRVTRLARENAGTRETTEAAMNTAGPSSSRPELAPHVRLPATRALAAKVERERSGCAPSPLVGEGSFS